MNTSLPKLVISANFFLSIGVEILSHTSVGSVSALKAALWQRIDIAFHSATHFVTWLPCPPQGLLSWELACQPETMWRWKVRGVRFDWDMEEMEDERGLLCGYKLKWEWLSCCTHAHTHTHTHTHRFFFFCAVSVELSFGSNELTVFVNGSWPSQRSILWKSLLI